MEVLNLFMFYRLLLACICLVLKVSAVEKVVFIYTPDSVKFLSSEPIHSSFLGDIFSAMMDYTTSNNINWHSLAAVPPWKRPEAIAVLEINGFNNDVDMTTEGTHFMLENAGDIAEQFDLLSLRTEERFIGQRPILVHMALGEKLHDSKIVQPVLLKTISADPEKRLNEALLNPQIRELIKESAFNISVPSEIQLLTELATVRQFLKALKTHKSEVHDNVPDVYWLKVGGLEPIVKTYGVKSLQFQEAIRLLRQIISEVKTAMPNIYDGNVVVAVMKVDNSVPDFGFRNRRLLETTAAPTPSEDKYNLAIFWNPMFPVVFIMVLFVTLALFVSILGVSVGMWNMDPGRDSIIYRAAQRIKKD